MPLSAANVLAFKACSLHLSALYEAKESQRSAPGLQRPGFMLLVWLGEAQTRWGTGSRLAFGLPPASLPPFKHVVPSPSLPACFHEEEEAGEGGIFHTPSLEKFLTWPSCQDVKERVGMQRALLGNASPSSDTHPPQSTYSESRCCRKQLLASLETADPSPSVRELHFPAMQSSPIPDPASLYLPTLGC